MNFRFRPVIALGLCAALLCPGESVAAVFPSTASSAQIRADSLFAMQTLSVVAGEFNGDLSPEAFVASRERETEAFARLRISLTDTYGPFSSHKVYSFFKHATEADLILTHVSDLENESHPRFVTALSNGQGRWTNGLEVVEAIEDVYDLDKTIRPTFKVLKLAQKRGTLAEVLANPNVHLRMSPASQDGVFHLLLEDTRNQRDYALDWHYDAPSRTLDIQHIAYTPSSEDTAFLNALLIVVLLVHHRQFSARIAERIRFEAVSANAGLRLWLRYIAETGISPDLRLLKEGDGTFEGSLNWSWAPTTTNALYPTIYEKIGATLQLLIWEAAASISEVLVALEPWSLIAEFQLQQKPPEVIQTNSNLAIVHVPLVEPIKAKEPPAPMRKPRRPKRVKVAAPAAVIAPPNPQDQFKALFLSLESVPHLKIVMTPLPEAGAPMFWIDLTRPTGGTHDAHGTFALIPMLSRADESERPRMLVVETRDKAISSWPVEVTQFIIRARHETIFEPVAFPANRQPSQFSQKSYIAAWEIAKRIREGAAPLEALVNTAKEQDLPVENAARAMAVLELISDAEAQKIIAQFRRQQKPPKPEIAAVPAPAPVVVDPVHVADTVEPAPITPAVVPEPAVPAARTPAPALRLPPQKPSQVAPTTPRLQPLVAPKPAVIPLQPKNPLPAVAPAPRQFPQQPPMTRSERWTNHILSRYVISATSLFQFLKPLIDDISTLEEILSVLRSPRVSEKLNKLELSFNEGEPRTLEALLDVFRAVGVLPKHEPEQAVVSPMTLEVQTNPEPQRNASYLSGRVRGYFHALVRYFSNWNIPSNETLRSQA